MADWSPWDVLPGAYVAVVAFAGSRVLGRWFDPVPRLPGATFLAVLLVLLGPELFGGRTLLPIDNLRGSVPFTEQAPTNPHGNLLQGDLLLLVAPLAKEARGDVVAGRWPLWNELSGIGMPLLADPQAQPFQPLVLLAYPFSPLIAPAVTAAFRILVALGFTFLFLRRRGCDEGPSLTGALAFGLGGFLLLWLGWPLANSASLFPFLLYAQERLLRRGAVRDEVLFSGALASFLLAGHPETVVLGLLAAAAFGLGGLPDPGSERTRAFRRWALISALAVALTAPVWLPTAAYLPETRRQASLSDSRPADDVGSSSPGALEAPGKASPLSESWIPVLAPNAFGNSRFVHYWGRQNTNEDASGFVGTAALLLAGLAFLNRRERLRGEVTALFTVVVVLTLLALPAAWIGRIHPIPVLGGLLAHGGHRALLFLCFSLAFLAAAGVQKAHRDPPPWRLVLALTVVLGSGLAWAYLSHPHPDDPALLEVFRVGWLHWQLRFLLLAAFFVLFLPRRRLSGYGIAFLLAAELCLLHGPAYPTMPRLDDWPSPAPLERLADVAARGDRILGLEGALPPNLASLYGFSDLRIYNPMAPAAYLRWLAPALDNAGADVAEISRPDSPLLATLGAKWLLAPTEGAMTPLHRIELRSSSGELYRRLDALPRLFFAAGPELDPGKALPLAGVTESLGPWIRSSLGAGDEGLLVATVFQHGSENPLQATGGWRLLADRRAIPTASTMAPFPAARTPVGATRLDLLYRPPGFLLGCWLSALAAAALGIRWSSSRLESPHERRQTDRTLPRLPGGIGGRRVDR